MSINIFPLLPQIGKLNKWLYEAEKELQKEFGMPLKLTVECLNNTYSIDAVVKLVSDILSVPVNKLLGTERFTQEKEARQVAMYLCRKYMPHITFEEIGDFFNKDHSTVMTSAKRVEELLALEDKSITTKVTACETQLLNLINPVNNGSAPDIHKA